jgi:hypothetical protein
MLRAMSTAHEQAKRMAIICVVAIVAINVAFYVLSGSYFDSHREIVGGVSVPSYSPEQMMHVRTMFAVFSGVIAAASFVAGIWPRMVGHLLTLLLGAFDLVAGAGAFRHDAPGVLWVTLLVSGVLMPVLAWHSYHRSRPAWAFLLAMCGVFAIVEFFGAPKAARSIDVSLWLALVLPGLHAVAAFALWSLRTAYVETDPAAG